MIDERLDDRSRYHFDWLEDRFAQAPGLTLMGRLRDGDPDARWASLSAREEEGLVDPMSQQLAMLWIVTCFLRSSQQVFELGPTLQRLFDETSIGALRGEMLRLPYPTFYLHLEDSSLSFKREDGAEVELDAIYIAESTISAPEAPAWWLISLISNARPDRRAVQLTFGWPHQDWVDSGAPFEAFLQSRYGEDAHGEHAGAYRAALRLITQTLLFLMGKHPELEEVTDPTRRRLLRDEERFDRKRRGERAREELDRRYTRARITRLAPSLERQAQTTHEASARRGAWVRGHWNYYWTGPRDEPEARQLVPRWIQPHWRQGHDEEQDSEDSPRGGDTTPRIYRLEADEGS